MTALHDRIRRDIEKRILAGEWRPGHRIPYEHELMADYGCARMTVNRAVSALVQAGLIARRKRAGSFVAAPRFARAALAIPDIRNEISEISLGLREKVQPFQLCTHGRLEQLRSREAACFGRRYRTAT